MGTLEDSFSIQYYCRLSHIHGISMRRVGWLSLHHSTLQDGLHSALEDNLDVRTCRPEGRAGWSVQAQDDKEKSIMLDITARSWVTDSHYVINSISFKCMQY
jgi:hypothetical protein